MGQLTRKERMMLQDQLRHEQVCISKYGRLLEERTELFHDVSQELAATSDGRFVPVDTFGRQAARGQEPADMRAWNWQGTYGPGAWQSTARQILFEREQAGSRPAPFTRGHQWGGLLPGDVPDTNHGDLTRGGLDQRGINLAGTGNQFTAPEPEGFPPPSRAAHVMPSHLESDGEHTARIWGEPDKSAPRAGSLGTGGWMSDTRFIYGGQEPGDTVPFGDEQHRFQGHLGWAHLNARRQPDILVRPSGPVSMPPVKMEAAEEWDGVNASPWSELTSPTPMDSDTWPRIASANAAVSPGTVTGSADDQTMLTDMLMTERFVSGAYDSTVFDSANPMVRQALQQIQRDEQRHGERIRGRLSNPPD